jgi:hypothetical protein
MMRSMRALTLAVATVIVCGIASLAAQTPFQFVVSASDASGKTVTELTADDVLMAENGVRVPVVKVEPYSLPLKVTMTVDNGSDTVEALGHIRAGLKGFVEAMPPDVEMTLISTSPQPRTVVKPTTDRAQVLRGLNGFAPESDQRPRFTDALVEFAQRLEKEEKDLKSGKLKLYTPVLVMVATAATEQTSYEPKEIEKALTTIVGRKTRVFVVITTTKAGDANQLQDIDRNRQAMIGRPATKMTNGLFETLSVSTRLTTLLPEWGGLLATLHGRQTSQFRVTVNRANSGPLQNPQFDLRNNMRGNVTMDGFLLQ